jgi:hypothetical protein
MKALVTLTMFVGAALLFFMQPMFGKMILPIFGGAPAVWITSVVFFQVMLLGGYLYAHVVKRVAVHALILLIPLATLPIRVRTGWGMISPEHPVPSVFLVLLSSVGLPFFVVSTTAPLLQRWFGSTTHARARDPFFLYAASNLGSIGALLAYPVVIEPYLRLDQQTLLWSIGYVILAALTLACARAVSKSQSAKIDAKQTAHEPAVPWRTRLRWIALAAVPSSLMLSVTSHVTTDIAPVPLLWIIPLALYLATFVLAFSPRTAFAARIASTALPFAVFIPIATVVTGMVEPPGFLVIHLIGFFLAALSCHGELAASRPPVARLTEFYVWLAVGGAIGGLFNVLVAPVVFHTFVEYPLGLILACLLRPDSKTSSVRSKDAAIALALGILAIATGLVARILRVPGGTVPFMVYLFALPAAIALIFHRRSVRFALALAAITVGAALYRDPDQSLVAAERSFYGVHKIMNRRSYRVLLNGNTHHGAQSLRASRRCEPLSYYYPTGPLGALFATFTGTRAKSDFAVIGLGTGSTGGYAKPGQRWTFYEIDPAIERIARNPHYFTFLRDCVPQARVVIGDARLSIANEPNGLHDLIVVDAFSSDAIPVHLLTREAMSLYVSKLAPNGVLAFHISNRYVNLRRVLGRLARDGHLVAYVREDREMSPLETYDGKAGSVWVVMARSSDDLGSLSVDSRWLRLPADVSGRSWTDDYSNVLETLKLRL